MFRKILLIFSLCGLTALSVFLEYHARAETYGCQPARVCLPEAPALCETQPCRFASTADDLRAMR